MYRSVGIFAVSSAGTGRGKTTGCFQSHKALDFALKGYIIRFDNSHNASSYNFSGNTLGLTCSDESRYDKAEANGETKTANNSWDSF